MVSDLPRHGVSSTTPLGKFAKKEPPWPVIKKTLSSWNCKGPRKCNDINLADRLSQLVLLNTN